MHAFYAVSRESCQNVVFLLLGYVFAKGTAKLKVVSFKLVAKQHSAALYKEHALHQACTELLKLFHFQDEDPDISLPYSAFEDWFL